MKKKSKDYYRKITESLPQGSDLVPHFLGYLTLFMALMAVLLTTYISLLALNLLEVKEQKTKATDNLAYWESVVRTHPNFTDGYYNAGFYSYILGDKGKAIGYVTKALKLDPNFEEAKELEKIIRK
jgi:tetratricopeptide (TPR) repeat protein